MSDPHSPSAAAEMPGAGEWRRLVMKTLVGSDFSLLQHRTRDDVVIEPLYQARRDALPIPGRGAHTWTVVQIVDDADPERANEQALSDVANCATGLQLRFAGSALAGGSGLPAAADALSIALDGVDLASVAIRIDPHPHVLETAAWLADLVARRGTAPERADIAFGIDPVGNQAVHEPTRAVDPQAFVACFAELRARGFTGALAELDARVVHEAGASEAQELAFVLASAVWWLRALPISSRPASAVLPSFGASLAVDCDQFLTIAKLRALRLLWWRLGELCGAEPTSLLVHAETSHRMMTRADPHTNLLRTTIAAAAAALGGADSIAVLPFTAATDAPDPSARALARNTQLILAEEAGLGLVADPAAGSGVFEDLTDALAEKAWVEFQRIESEGGVLESLRQGAFQARVATARAALAAGLCSGASPLVGATIYRAGEVDGPVRELESSEAGRAFSAIRLEDLARAAA